MHVTSAHVDGYYVVLKLSDGSSVERDFSHVRGPALNRIHRRDGLGLDPRVRVANGALSWPNEIDFELDLILWGWPRSRRRRRPLRRALVGEAGSLIPAPLVREVR